MKSRIVAAWASALFLCVAPARAQTLSEIEARYGAPVKSYPVSENLWMSPEFADDGQLCAARLYPKKIDASTNYLSPTASLWEVGEVFDELAPPSVRGRKREDYGALIAGGMIFSGFGYENVRINFVSALSGAKGPAQEAAEFPGVRSAQVVTITCLSRKCSSR